jgi:hypothetical protein
MSGRLILRSKQTPLRSWPSSVRSGIFVENQNQNNFKPRRGGISSNDSARFENGLLAKDAAPDGAWKLFLPEFYKDVAPMALVSINCRQPNSDFCFIFSFHRSSIGIGEEIYYVGV